MHETETDKKVDCAICDDIRRRLRARKLLVSDDNSTLPKHVSRAVDETQTRVRYAQIEETVEDAEQAFVSLTIRAREARLYCDLLHEIVSILHDERLPASALEKVEEVMGRFEQVEKKPSNQSKFVPMSRRGRGLTNDSL